MTKEEKEEEEQIVLSNKELHAKYLAAKKLAADHLNRLALIDMDIRRVEAFLEKSGFGGFNKTYITNQGDPIDLNFDGKKLLFGPVSFLESGTHLISAKVRVRLEAYQFLGDFLESIASFHANLGVKHEIR